MAHVMLPVGMERFSDLRTKGCYYVDKTPMIEELLENQFVVNLITRPRRFGKTLAMSMLADFFDIRKNSRSVFEDLKIAENEVLCQNWMNQRPVLFLTLKSAEGLNFQSAYAMLTAILSDLCISCYDLLDSPRIRDVDKKMFCRLAEKTASEEEIKNSLYVLSRMMYSHYGKPVILLIDEYDVPLARASECGYYEQMLDVLRGLIGKALKTNEFLEFAVVTGCLRIAKESIFTGTNNFVSSSISDESFSDSFGFTEGEVTKLLEAAGFEDKAETLKEWYDGYLFGMQEIYCPWDVLNYVCRLQRRSDSEPENYWKNTSHNGIIRSFIDRTDLVVGEKFEILLSGGCVQETIQEDLTYDVLHSSESNLWSILYLTGYLTREHGRTAEAGKMLLKIPNEEVKSIFADTVAAWFQENVCRMDRRQLFDAFWSGDAEKATTLVTDMLFDTISYYDYKEDFYHAFLAGLFAGAGYAVESNREHGLGRPDLVVRDKKNRRVLIVETKHAALAEQMEAAAETALGQIDAKKYAGQFLKGYRTVLCYGAAFFEKECLIKKSERQL